MKFIKIGSLRLLSLFFFSVLYLCSNVKSYAQQQVPSLSGLTPAYRIPYHQWDWKTYRTPFAHIYFPVGMDSVCRFTLNHFQQIKTEMEKKSGMSLKAMPSLVIYPSVGQAYESRIGSWDVGNNAFPTIARQGNRMVLGFDGSYAAFADQVRVACVRSMWQQAFGYYNGTDIRNTAAEQEWQWFKEGTIQYLATGFSMKDNEVLYQWYRLQALPVQWSVIAETEAEEQALCVKGFCYFLERTYRKDAVKQILFQLKRKKPLNTAVRLVCKRSLSQLQQAYCSFLQKQYTDPLSTADTIPEVFSFADSVQAKGAVHIVYQSADSQLLVYTRNDPVQRSVWIQERNKTPRRIYRYQLPPWIFHHSWDVYPLVVVKDRRIYIVAEQKGRVMISEYSLQGAKLNSTNLPQGIDGISSLLPLDERQWLMTAYTKGRSDVIRFQPRSLKISALTNDLADNMQLCIDPQTQQLTYYSGYPDHTRLKHPRPVSKDSPVLDTIKGKPYGIYSRKVDVGAEYLVQSDSLLFQEMLAAEASGDTANHTLPFYQKYWLAAYRKQKQVNDSLQALEAKYKKNSSSGSFLQQVLQVDTGTIQEKDWTVFDPKQVSPYRVQLHTLWFQAGINNDYFINRLQPYQGYLGTFKFPEIGGLFNTGYSDLFEQHQFNIGYKLPAGTEGSDFFVRYQNKRKRLDWYALYFRKVESLKPDPRQEWVDAQGRPYPAAAKIKTYYYELGFNYPFSYRTALSATAAYRKGRTVFLATDRYSLSYPALEEQWSINSIALNHQQLYATTANNAFYRGFRNKLLLDVMMRIGKTGAFAYGVSNQFEWHQPLHKAVNWVTKLKTGYSGGGEHILYTFGGVDHNVNGKVDSSVLFDQQAPYVFQSLITELRGFPQNSLYGNVYGLLNTDIYFQLFDGLLETKTPYSFFNRLQLGAFADVAMAKEIWNANAVWQQCHSFGLSAKTIFAGYPMRLDLAFPYNFAHAPMLHFSLSL